MAAALRSVTPSPSPCPHFARSAEDASTNGKLMRMADALVERAMEMAATGTVDESFKVCGGVVGGGWMRIWRVGRKGVAE